jgi:hypothetical protein
MCELRKRSDEEEITPDMIEAGVAELIACDLRYESREEMIIRIWFAMAARRAPAEVVGSPTQSGP